MPTTPKIRRWLQTAIATAAAPTPPMPFQRQVRAYPDAAKSVPHKTVAAR